ncbi:MAG: hypothetical protein A9Z00_00870 [Thermobacillus sp. ZCTH02-B1]|uniref:L-fucose/L-arabinose isomerase family protein n=1 Tax=Thermobacillus sp. ZCTH02-B1 TaxID=1858795 RepID=UPI000B57759F|nr:hypothetical protein [Thermobacillus sp. ZCTH02-B1]OUM94204.1 MAG: hypothetical protein A9Z00_00870 [Thermobacillus sp. ZCTH02-B1]
MFAATIAYFPIGRKTFDMEAAERLFRESEELLRGMADRVLSPGAVLTSVEELTAWMDGIRGEKPDLVVYQSLTFADAEFIAAIAGHFPAEVLVWSVREPSVGGRLRLNSLTGGNSTCNALRMMGRKYDFILGNPDEPRVGRRLRVKLRAAETVRKLRGLTVGVVGDHPPGFFFSGADELELRNRFGIRLHRLDLYRLFRESRDVPEERYLPLIAAAASGVTGLDAGAETTVRYAQFAAALKDHVARLGIRATAIRCWPDFFTELGAAACSTLSLFTEEGVVSSCEADILGAVTMYIQRELSGGSPPYLGDLVHVDEAENSVTFWHCGAGAWSLANPATGARAGVHPNRKLGFTLEFGLKPGPVTIARLGKTNAGYRMLIMKGEVLDRPQAFFGTSGEVRLSGNVSEIVHALMKEGFEPHYSLVYADIAEELMELCGQLGIEAVNYT